MSRLRLRNRQGVSGKPGLRRKSTELSDEAENRGSHYSENTCSSTSIFREYDIRGIADEELPDADVELLGRALATYIIRHSGRTVCAGPGLPIEQ